jgi:hypothetical protein
MKTIKLFEDKHVRTIWNDSEEKWYFSIIDVIAVLSESSNPRKYWSVLKLRLKKEGSQLTTNCSQLKMQAQDGKYYKTDVADTEQLFRLIQSIPSPKAEPFKNWLAQIAKERIDEMQDPELSIDRSLELPDELKRLGILEGQQFATLTDIITKYWAGITTKEYKTLKGLKKENLRDNMTNTELILNMLAEASTKDISQAVNPNSFEESKLIAKQGGNIAGNARKELEAKTGKKVVTKLNAQKIINQNKKLD